MRALALFIIFLVGNVKFSREDEDLEATTGQCPINLVIVIDISGSACGGAEFQHVIDETVKLIEALQAHKNRAAVLLFSTDVEKTVTSDQFGDAATFMDAVRGLECNGDSTNIENAMTQAIKHFMDHDHVLPNSHKVMLVITDGQDNTNVGNARVAANAVEITVYAAGYEKFDDNTEILRQIAGDDEHLLKLDELTRILDKSCGMLEWTTTIETDLSEEEEKESEEGDVVTLNAPRRCACNLRGAWLDIVLVIDSSKAVSRQDFRALTQGIGSLVQQMTVGLTLDGKYSRVAVVKMSKAVERAADLSSFNNSLEAANTIKNMAQGIRNSDNNVNGESVNIAAGLLEAQNILRDRRPNVKGLVILFSSSDVPCHTTSYRNKRKRAVSEDDDPCRVAERIKNEGNILATVALKFGKVKTYPSLNISTPCYGINSDLSLWANVKKMICDANCFCLEPYVQFKATDICEMYGECIYMQSISTDYHTASDTCEAYNSSLVDIFSESKNDFIRKLHEGAQLTPYWIGLSTESGSGIWNNGIELKPHDYVNWASGNPDESNGKCTAVDVENGQALWKSERCNLLEKSKFFSCQKMPCDSDNYCDYIL